MRDDQLALNDHMIATTNDAIARRWMLKLATTIHRHLHRATTRSISLRQSFDTATLP
jgi:hypothetical protein